MSKNVLVADDDKTIRALLGKTLVKLEVANVVEAADGNEALGLVNCIDFDLILLDWDMPGKTGLEVLRAIRMRNTKVPVIMVTAENSRERVQEAIAAGVTFYMVKPFDPTRLKANLEIYCRKGEVAVDGSVYRCRSVMNPHVVTISPDATVGEAIDLLLHHGISGLPVVDANKRLVGLVSEFNLIESITHPDLRQKSVRSLMNPQITTVREDSLPSEVVGLMQRQRIRRVPVVRDGEVVGIISRRDILRYVTEHEEVLRQFLEEVKSLALS